MSLNHIQLNPQLIADLYPNALVNTQNTASAPETAAPLFLGSNEKQILILVNHAEAPYLPDHELAFLTSILSACRVTLSDVAIVNIQKTAPDLIERVPAVNVILFGMEPSAINLPVHFPAYQLQRFNKCFYLHCAPLSEVEKNKEVKSQLWSGLKKMFNI